MFNHLFTRSAQLKKAQEAFLKWDAKLHDKNSGAFSFCEFSEMLYGSVSGEIDEDDAMDLFNQFHDLILEEKKDLGYVDDGVGQGEVKEEGEELVKIAEMCEKEMEEADEIEEKERRVKAATKKRRQSVVMLKGEEGADAHSMRPEMRSVLPARSRAHTTWKLAFKKVKSNFLKEEFNVSDVMEELLARKMESTGGGLKFGASAFSQLLWENRLFVKDQ